MGKAPKSFAMHRGRFKRRRSLFPLPLGDVTRVREAAKMASFEDFCEPHFAGLDTEDLWLALAVLGLNSTAGFGRAELDATPINAAAAGGATNAQADDKTRLAPGSAA
eukprot:s165_g8.t1